MNNVLNILLVEDDEVDRLTIKRALRKNNLDYRIESCSDARQSMEVIKEQQFDIILLDYRLPDANGIDVLRSLKVHAGRTPIIIITSQGDEKVAAAAIKGGASDYIPKSLLTPEGLIQSIRNALRIKQIEEEKELAEAALMESNERLSTLIANAQVIVFSVDKNETMVLNEGKALGAIGLEAGDSVGIQVEKYFKNWPQITEAIRRALKGQPSEEVYEVNNRFFNTTYQPILDRKGKVQGVTGISTDVTQRIQAEKALVQAKELAEETAQVKQDFLANMSHEIRTPMNAIIGFTNLLRETGLNTDQKEYVDAIQSSGENLLVLINDILDFSKIEAGKMPIDKVDFDLDKLLRTLETTYRVKAQEKELAYTVEKDPKLPSHLVGDPVRVNQVLVNLIGNAIKFTDAGSVTVRAQAMHQTDKEARIRFSVADTGIGIPAEKLEHVFDSFTQVSSDYQRKFGGTGLGLAIARNLVELQNGHIGVESEAGKGSEFAVELTFPIAKKSTDTAGDAAATTHKSLAGLNILLVEDNLLNQKLATRVLEQLDARVELAENGRIAVEKLASNDYHIVLMDVQMPEMDGLTATKHIREQLQKSVPIIALTAHAMKEEIERCLDAGMNAHIIKPFKKDELIGKIHELINS